MKTSRWERIEEVFFGALAQPPSERDAWLEARYPDDPALRAEVERLLADDARPSAVLDDPPAPLRTDPRIGQRVGVYELEERIAEGGMGVVYRARRADGAFEQSVAIKLLRLEAATEEALRRFEFERQTLASLEHPGIARLLDGGTTADGIPFLVMELVDGQPIDQHCDAQQLSVPERLRLFTEVCRTVHFAHQNLVVHRDLKPANILADRTGRPRLLDFGIARLLDPAGQVPAVTRTLARVMTPEYASPEQLAGEPVTVASDVYALGVVLYELLTGRKPFRCDSRSPAEWERVIRTRPPTRPSTVVGHAVADARATTPKRLRRQLTGDLDRVVLMALRKEPMRRYESALHLARDVERHLEGRPVDARPDAIVYRARSFARRHRLAVTSTALILLGLVGALVMALRGERRARAEAAHTRIEADSFRGIVNFMMDAFLTSGEFDDAEARDRARARIQEQAAVVRRQHDGDAHLRANLLDALGRTCTLLDLHADAEDLVLEAHDLRLETFGAKTLEVALSLQSLGDLRYRQRRFTDAVEVLRRALALHRECPPSTHTDVALAANNLAVMLRNQGAPAEAQELYLEALALRRAAGARTLPVAETLNNLAGVHLDRGDGPGARAALEEALEIRTEILGPGHPLTLQTLSNLASADWALQETDSARARLRKAADGLRALGARGQDGLITTLVNLSVLEQVAGEVEAAHDRLEEARDLATDKFGPGHPQVAHLIGKLADLAAARGRSRDALILWGEAATILRAHGPTPQLAMALRGQASALIAGQEYGEAETLLREALALLTEDPAAKRPRCRTLLSLGDCLGRQGRLPEAIAAMEQGVALLEEDGVGRAGELVSWRGRLEELRTNAEKDH